MRAYDTSGNVSYRSNIVGVTVRKLADLNTDGSVNIRDLSILLSRWGTTDRPADINGDGRVNIRDLSILLSRWGE